MPGIRLDVVDDAGRPVPTGTEGMLAVHRADSSLVFFDGYVGAEGQGWVGDYYLTGDTVEQNEDGSISFVGRSDDVIPSAGHRIGPVRRRELPARARRRYRERRRRQARRPTW
ncbi:MAG TPA: hypothetical protein VMY16_09325 [Ilumatobacteraceae bacterium]|nr:hypothetical protein [Ilumatobacteraceae bacterium]